MASLLGLVFGGLRIADAVGTASDYSRSVQLADVGRQITALAQAMEDERDHTVGVQALTMLDEDAVADKAGQQVTAPLEHDLQQEQAAAGPRPRARRTPPPRAHDRAGRGHRLRVPREHPGPRPRRCSTRSGTCPASAAVSPQPAKGQTQIEADQNALTSETPIEVIESYSGVLSILFALEDEITIGSGDVQLGDDVRALSALSAAEDQASQQRAILYGAFLASALNDAGDD